MNDQKEQPRAALSDLEMTQLCAEAMGFLTREVNNGIEKHVGTVAGRYDPLHDDAQAMALVKKLGLDIQHAYWSDPVVSKHDAHGKLLGEACNADLNQAIVECVAKMQRER